ncbi:hypothetical protein B0H13DRAFT_2301165 [Mycena leptocephala]|nr:hypothetical protein B0H13DRAFT_2301165 [Mycena leptocephala]
MRRIACAGVYTRSLDFCASGKVVVRKITVWTENSNTYDIFNSLRAKPLYNEIPKSSVDVLIRDDFKLRVLLLPGKKNSHPRDGRNTPSGVIVPDATD